MTSLSATRAERLEALSTLPSDYGFKPWRERERAQAACRVATMLRHKKAEARRIDALAIKTAYAWEAFDIPHYCAWGEGMAQVASLYQTGSPRPDYRGHGCLAWGR